MPSPLTVSHLLDVFPDFPGEYVSYLERYVNGDDIRMSDKDFDTVMINLSDFTKKVLSECRNIERGKTVTYSELAARIGQPKAVRAVASALGRNPVPVLVPCHRVVSKNGLGGYAFGPEIKKLLLREENIIR